MTFKLRLRADADRRQLANSAAAMFGGAGLLSFAELAIPGGPDIDPTAALAAFGFALGLLLLGARLPIPALAALGPIGAALVAFALASGGGAGDGAVLYVWPVLWEAYFFGLEGTILIVLWVGLAHGVSVGASPPGADVDRWLDVFASVAVVGSVVELLGRRNRALHSRLAEELTLDQLTGLLNRRGFDQRAAIEISRARRDLGSMAIVTFDLDRFKSVNDRFGHAAGDLVLIRMGNTFRAEMRDTDVLARMGGEEFAALLPGGGIEEARSFAERVRVGFERATAAQNPSVTVSAGVTAAVAPEGVAELLNQADSAMYEAKFEGRNRTAVYRQASPAFRVSPDSPAEPRRPGRSTPSPSPPAPGPPPRP